MTRQRPTPVADPRPLTRARARTLSIKATGLNKPKHDGHWTTKTNPVADTPESKDLAQPFLTSKGYDLRPARPYLALAVEAVVATSNGGIRQPHSRGGCSRV